MHTWCLQPGHFPIEAYSFSGFHFLLDDLCHVLRCEVSEHAQAFISSPWLRGPETFLVF
jgi:hypothetical protein